jgi:glycosyltransferase involved in cell wall biosynthesis
MPAISVIVPLYNKARFIERAIDAILEQSLTDFEVIVVNDGSSDGSEQIVAARAARDQRLRLVSQANAGPGSARNLGAGMAASPLLAFLDGDDAWDRDYLRESVRHLRTAASDVAALTWGMMVHPQRETTEASWRELGIPHGVFRATPETPARLIVAMLANMLPSSTVMRKSAFDELGGFYARYRCVYSEDAYLYLKMLMRYSATFDHRPLTIRYEDASELAVNRTRVRPIEPFLTDPDDLVRTCPPAMRGLLRDVLAWRALKTASVYGYWGRHRQARQIAGRFASLRNWRTPYFMTALLSCTPVAGWAGALARATRGKRNAN